MKAKKGSAMQVKNRVLRCLMTAGVICGVQMLPASGVAAERSRPNVLFIAIDDLNDWVGCLGGHPQAITPNIDRLAERGTLFTAAHSQAPICNPSRLSLMTGLRPSTTGYYGLGGFLRNHSDPEIRDAVTLDEYFARHGYAAAEVGKVHHWPGSKIIRDQSIEIGPHSNYWPFPPGGKIVENIPNGNLKEVDWGTWPHKDEDRSDCKTATWAVNKIQSWPKDKPNFLAVGFMLPHVPMFAPPKWFDMFPLESLQLPVVPDDDRDDTPDFSWYLGWRVPEPRLSWLKENKQWRPMVQAYLACTAYMDAQLGRVLDALEQSGMADNTVIVLWGDNGFHLGEKGITAKCSLWSEASRVPFIFAGPNVNAGVRCESPVELLDIYPTLLDLCGLPEKEGLEGVSLVPQLEDAAAPRPRPAITTMSQNNHAVRTPEWCYIRYADGSEELYDREQDPGEWTNLANNPEHKATIKKLRPLLPKVNAKPAPGGPWFLLEHKEDGWYWGGLGHGGNKKIVPEEVQK